MSDAISSSDAGIICKARAPYCDISIRQRPALPSVIISTSHILPVYLCICVHVQRDRIFTPRDRRDQRRVRVRSRKLQARVCKNANVRLPCNTLQLAEERKDAWLAAVLNVFAIRYAAPATFPSPGLLRIKRRECFYLG